MRVRATRLFPLYSVAVFVSGAAGLIASLTLQSPPVHFALVLLVVSALIAENLAVALPRLTTSVSYSLSIAANVMFGPAAAGLVSLCAAVDLDDVRNKPSVQLIAFNMGQVLLAHLGAGWLYLALGGRTLYSDTVGFQPFAEAEFPAILVSFLALGVFASGANDLLVGAGYALRYQVAFRRLWKEHLQWHFLVQLSLTVVAVSIAQVMAVQVLGLVLFVFPLLVARQVYQHYLALRQSYIDTIRSLVAALEAKDRYTAGHSERVAEYAVGVARSMQLDDEILERINLAAQVHDLGKVSIPDEVLSKPGRLTTTEFELIRQHPESGAEIVARVPGLEHIVPVVRHHHERFDGAGYCAGLAGEDIPIEARIMAVADSFDAMTSSRSYRPAMTIEAAMEELRSCAGTQFDPCVVQHFLNHLSTEERGADA